ncbi:Proprotein convertase, P [Erythrobacter sp. SD-21]|nr:Proprotein convertase, P [Erythrobacter sp. SD-21]
MRIFATVRTLVLAIGLLIGVGVIDAQEARAQTATIDWADTGIASQGALPTPITVNGSDGTVATLSYATQTEGGGSFTNPYADTFVSYFSGTIGSGASPLLMGFDNSSYDPRDKITITISLSRAVSNLSFSLGDIDAGSFTDAVEVYYDNDSTGSFANAASTTSFWTTGSSVARTNDATVNGWRGTAGSATSSTDGNINLDFGTQSVQRIRIVYFSYTGSGNPSSQFAGVSDLIYSGTGADLSLSKALIGDAPVEGGTATYRLTLSNSSASFQTANSVTVRDTLPAQFAFSSATGSGSFNSTTGIWSVASLAPGASVSIDIIGTISAVSGTTITNRAEVTASSVRDFDSTPDNGITTEDDYASASFVVANGRLAGTPPVLLCPAGTSRFDWDAVTWTDGDTEEAIAFSTFGNLNVSIANPGSFVNNAGYGGQSPAVDTSFQGGLSPAENSLIVFVNMASVSDRTTITLTLPRAFAGVQFTIFDVDNGNQFADRIEVTGTGPSETILPTLTNGVANSVTGNVATGDASSDQTQDLGNLVVTFEDYVQTIVISYGNGSAAPSNPGIQAIGIHDLDVCTPFTTLSVTKVSSVVSDPVNQLDNPKAIPGAVVEYLITLTNTGDEPVDTDTVFVTDDGPADAKMCLTAFGGGSGPVRFADGSPGSGVTYTFATLDSLTDDLEFSSDSGATWTYIPTADAQGCDGSISDFRVNPKGAFAAARSFTLRVRFIVE